LISYALREVPVGIQATGTRRERDSVGSIDVPANRYWGASTQRALKAAPAYADSMPERFFRCYGYVKRGVALMNAQAGRLPLWKTAAIARAADDLIGGLLADQFPLPIWNAGFGREADMNVNEVLANRAAQLLGAAAGRRDPIDAAQDVNMVQSVGGGFSASMYIATIMEIEDGLVPRCSALARAIERNPNQSPSGHGRRLTAALGRLDEAEGSLHEIGADTCDAGMAAAMTAADWQIVVATIAADTGRPFIVAPDGFSDRTSVDSMVAAMAAVRGVAIVLLDIAEAVHASLNAESMAAGRALSEAMAMVCRYVIGQDQMVAATASGGSLAEAMAIPLIAASVLNALRRLGECCEAMRRMVAHGR
jgi:fumarate hydratase class II